MAAVFTYRAFVSAAFAIITFITFFGFGFAFVSFTGFVLAFFFAFFIFAFIAFIAFIRLFRRGRSRSSIISKAEKFLQHAKAVIHALWIEIFQRNTCWFSPILPHELLLGDANQSLVHVLTHPLILLHITEQRDKCVSCLSPFRWVSDVARNEVDQTLWKQHISIRAGILFFRRGRLRSPATTKKK